MLPVRLSNPQRRAFKLRPESDAGVSYTGSQLEQLSGMTVLSVDTGDLTVVKQMAATGLITDATTNPLFVSQAGQNNDPVYAAFVAEVKHPHPSSS
jgi:transaldolase